MNWLTARPIAHRGFHDLNRECWENTLPAFQAAIDRSYAIECDVHLSKDGVPMVFHDDELGRLAGQPGHVWNKTAAELRQMRIGETKAAIPSLNDALDLVSGRVPLIVELKGSGEHGEGLVAAVAARLKAYEGPCAMMSFDHRLVRRFRTEAAGIPAGLTAEGRGARDMEAHFSMLANGLSFVSYNVDDLPNPFVTFVRERLAMPVITWTIRDETGVEATRRHADQITFEGFAA
nr:glycerophosphodiester phosphodiesterase [Nitratireductor luteus]